MNNRLGTFYLAAAMLLYAEQAHAQRISGRVSSDAGPVAGAIVQAMNATGQVIGSALTNPSGRYAIDVPTTAMHSIHVEMIGFRPADVLLSLAPGARLFDVDVVLSAQPISLDALEAKGGRVCRIDEDGALSETARVWADARAALTITDWSVRTGIDPFVVKKFERVRAANQLVHEWMDETVDTTYAVQPFAARPLATVAREGLVERFADGTFVFHGPGPEVLLSDWFLHNHCFTVKRSRKLVGLKFEPLPDNTKPDIEGTLWLDQRTGQLKRVDFTYVAKDEYHGRGNSLASGWAEFDRLPDGRWLISEWFLSSPVTRPGADGALLKIRSDPNSILMKEAGGHVERRIP